MGVIVDIVKGFLDEEVKSEEINALFCAVKDTILMG